MISHKVGIILFWLGAIVLLCIGATGIFFVKAMTLAQNLATGVVRRLILR